MQSKGYDWIRLVFAEVECCKVVFDRTPVYDRVIIHMYTALPYT